MKHRMPGELTECDNNIKEEMKVTVSEIKKNPQGTNREGKGVWIQIKVLERKEEIYKHLTTTERRNKNF